MATDPQVSRIKFRREVQRLGRAQNRNAKMGLWVLRAEFPEVLVAFATPNPTQVSIAFAALIDFTDYDAHPLAVTLVHPCTEKVLKYSEILPQEFPNLPIQSSPRIARLRSSGGGLTVDSIVQAYGQEDEAPFLCLPGVRAYHDHPAHTGDSWWLHKMSGEGSLHSILHTLWKYGVSNVIGQSLNIQVRVSGFQVRPEIEVSPPTNPQNSPPAAPLAHPPEETNT